MSGKKNPPMERSRTRHQVLDSPVPLARDGELRALSVTRKESSVPQKVRILRT